MQSTGMQMGGVQDYADYMNQYVARTQTCLGRVGLRPVTDIGRWDRIGNGVEEQLKCKSMLKVYVVRKDCSNKLLRCCIQLQSTLTL